MPSINQLIHVRLARASRNGNVPSWSPETPFKAGPEKAQCNGRLHVVKRHEYDVTSQLHTKRLKMATCSEQVRKALESFLKSVRSCKCPRVRDTR